jgi:hypothetical protein
LDDAIRELRKARNRLEIEAGTVGGESHQQNNEGFGFGAAAKKIREAKSQATVVTNEPEVEAGKTAPYVEIDLAGRTLTVGERKITPSDKVWEFLKGLADAKRHSLPDLKPVEWKNAYDMLRRKIDKENLQFVVEATDQRYKLAASVTLKGGGQMGIHRTK